MHEVQSGHMLTSHLRVDTEHFGVVEGIYKRQYMPDGGIVEIRARLIWPWVPRPVSGHIVVKYVFGEEVHSLPVTFDVIQGILTSIRIATLAPTPEDINFCTISTPKSMAFIVF
jgi:hypothetical protein